MEQAAFWLGFNLGGIPGFEFGVWFMSLLVVKEAKQCESKYRIEVKRVSYTEHTKICAMDHINHCQHMKRWINPHLKPIMARRINVEYCINMETTG